MLGDQYEVFMRAAVDEPALYKSVEAQLRLGDPTLLRWEFLSGLGLPIGECDPSKVPELQEPWDRFLTQYARGLVVDELSNLPGNIQMDGDQMIIWRCMTVRRDWMDGEMWERPLGVCWTFDPEFADAHFGYLGSPDEVRMVMKALVSPFDVDWQATVELNALDEYLTDEEREIRLKEDSVVQLVSVQFSDEESPRDVSHLRLVLPAGATAPSMALAM